MKLLFVTTLPRALGLPWKKAFRIGLPQAQRPRWTPTPQSNRAYTKEPSTGQYISPPSSSWAWLSEESPEYPWSLTWPFLRGRWGTTHKASLKWHFTVRGPTCPRVLPLVAAKLNHFEFPLLSKLFFKNAKTPKTHQNLHLSFLSFRAPHTFLLISPSFPSSNHKRYSFLSSQLFIFRKRMLCLGPLCFHPFMLTHDTD